MASQAGQDYAEATAPEVWNLMPDNRPGKWTSDMEDEISEKIFESIAEAYTAGFYEAEQQITVRLLRTLGLD